MKTLLKSAILALFIFPFNACGDESEKTAQWTNLLEGSDINENWRLVSNPKDSQQKLIGKRWSLSDGILELKRKEIAKGPGGSIETHKKYFNFELQFEFKIAFNSNSGIKYRQLNALGFEYQIIDDENYRHNAATLRTGELYSIKKEESPRILKKHTEWNTGKIIANGNHLEHWLNGQKVLDLEVGSEEWKKLYNKSKYYRAGVKNFGSHVGFIHIQDHSDTGITFRKMIIRKL